MPNLNKVMLMGNITSDPEIKYTPKGTACAGIGLAINRKWKNEAGVAQEETTFVDVEAWGRTAEVICEHFRKGSPIFIEGRLKLDTWDDKQTGQKRSKMRVVCESFEFLANKGKQGEGESQPAAGQPAGRSFNRPVPPALPTDDTSDIPF